MRPKTIKRVIKFLKKSTSLPTVLSKVQGERVIVLNHPKDFPLMGGQETHPPFIPMSSALFLHIPLSLL